MNYQTEVGTKETTVVSEFFDITSIVSMENLPKEFQKVFLGKFSAPLYHKYAYLEHF